MLCPWHDFDAIRRADDDTGLTPCTSLLIDYCKLPWLALPNRLSRHTHRLTTPPLVTNQLRQASSCCVPPRSWRRSYGGPADHKPATSALKTPPHSIQRETQSESQIPPHAGDHRRRKSRARPCRTFL